MPMRRVSSTSTVTIANAAALSNVVDFTGAAGGMIDMPAAWTTAQLGFHHCATRGGTFQPLYDEDGTLVEVALPADPSDLSYLLPAELFPARFVKLWSEISAADENQGAERSIILSLKT